jgi:D-inositol-3-phosphate glycosyltransferase
MRGSSSSVAVDNDVRRRTLVPAGTEQKRGRGKQLMAPFDSGGHKVHILFVLEFYFPHVGGLETLFQHLAEGLVQHGYRVTVVTLWLPGTDKRETHNGVGIVRVKTPGFAQRYLFMLYALPTVLRKERVADLIHTTTYNAALPAWLASRIARRPAIITVHEVFAEQWQQLPGLNPLLGYAFRAFEWAILHLPFAHFIGDSNFTARRLQQRMRIASSKVSAVYPAVDYEFWDRAQHVRRVLKDEVPGIADGPVYLYFGRAGLSKGLGYLIEAARIIQRARPDSHGIFILARDPLTPYERALRQIARYGLAEHVIVLDPVPRVELPGYLLAADCVVVPSISEGFGYAAVEAATLGCPVVTTTGHSVEEVLHDSARFVAPRDPVALAKAILDTMQDRPEWREPGRYDVARHIAGVEMVYGRLKHR